MEFKKVYSQVPACSIGQTPNATLSCLKCDMMHIGSSMKLFVPVDQPVPVRAEVDKTVLEAGDAMTCKVSFDAAVEEAKVTTMIGDGLVLDNLTVSGQEVTAVVSAGAGFAGFRSVAIGYMGVQKMFSCEVKRPAAEEAAGIVSITAEPKQIEVGGKSVITVKFDKALTADELPTLEATAGLSVAKELALEAEPGEVATAEVSGDAETEEGLVTATMGEEKSAVKVTVKAAASTK